MPYDHPRLTRACAELIRQWHQRYGVFNPPSNMSEGQFLRYKERVDFFHQADLSDPQMQLEIGREQQAGVFEWFYTRAIPAELWSEVAREHEILDHPTPEHLGEAARWILKPLRSVDMRQLPRDDKSRLVVKAHNRWGLFEQARHFYADVVAEQRDGIGGLNVLISCSLERYRWDGASEQDATLLRPEVLGLRVVAIGERPDDLVDAIREGQLVIESTIGGPTEPIDRPDQLDESDGER